jgi:hypothetical protein
MSVSVEILSLSLSLLSVVVTVEALDGTHINHSNYILWGIVQKPVA